MKKLLPLVLLCVMTASVYATNFLNYAEYLADKHVIVRQRPATNYSLDDRVLRQEVVGIAIRLTGLNFRTVASIALPDPYTCENTFIDVKQNVPNSWACRSVEIAAKNGIISSTNKEFRPEGEITRAEAIAMMLSAVKLMPKTDTTQTWQTTVMQTSKTLWIVTDATMSPDEKITRGELFSVVSNIIRVLYQQEIDYIDSLAQ